MNIDELRNKFEDNFGSKLYFIKQHPQMHEQSFVDGARFAQDYFETLVLIQAEQIEGMKFDQTSYERINEIIGEELNKSNATIEGMKAERECPKSLCEYWIGQPEARQKNACMNISCIRHRENDDYFKPKEGTK